MSINKRIKSKPDNETLIQNLIGWANEQPEYKTGNFPDVDRKINPVDKLKLAKWAESAKKLCPPDSDWPVILGSEITPQDPLTALVRNFIHALGKNGVNAILSALVTSRITEDGESRRVEGLLDALCKHINTLPDIMQPNIGVMSWQEAKKRAEKRIENEQFPGIVKLAKIAPCSRGTMRKAINRSDILTKAEQNYKNHSGIPSAVSLNDKVLAKQKADKEIDPSIAADTDAILNKLIDNAPVEKKAQTQAEINNMSKEQKQELAVAYAQQFDDERQDDPKERKRKPRRRKP